MESCRAFKVPSLLVQPDPHHELERSQAVWLEGGQGCSYSYTSPVLDNTEALPTEWVVWGHAYRRPVVSRDPCTAAVCRASHEGQWTTSGECLFLWCSARFLPAYRLHSTYTGENTIEPY